jgi:hypothetical protein
MGWGIYKQPDDLFAIWSTIVDDFIWYDCSIEDVKQIWKEEFGRSGESSLDRQMAYTDDMIRSIRPGRESFHTRFRWREFIHVERGEPIGDGPYQAWLAKWRTPEMEAEVAQLRTDSAQ